MIQTLSSEDLCNQIAQFKQYVYREFYCRHSSTINLTALQEIIIIIRVFQSELAQRQRMALLNG